MSNISNISSISNISNQATIISQNNINNVQFRSNVNYVNHVNQMPRYGTMMNINTKRPISISNKKQIVCNKMANASSVNIKNMKMKNRIIQNKSTIRKNNRIARNTIKYIQQKQPLSAQQTSAHKIIKRESCSNHNIMGYNRCKVQQKASHCNHNHSHTINHSKIKIEASCQNPKFAMNTNKTAIFDTDSKCPSIPCKSQQQKQSLFECPICNKVKEYSHIL